MCVFCFFLFSFCVCFFLVFLCGFFRFLVDFPLLLVRFVRFHVFLPLFACFFLRSFACLCTSSAPSFFLPCLPPFSFLCYVFFPFLVCCDRVYGPHLSHLFRKCAVATTENDEAVFRAGANRVLVSARIAASRVLFLKKRQTGQLRAKLVGKERLYGRQRVAFLVRCHNHVGYCVL